MRIDQEDDSPTRTRTRSNPRVARQTVQQAAHKEAATREPVRDRLGRVVTRKRKASDDKFAIDERRIPQGWTYEWKRWSTFGQEDRGYMMSLEENGWTPVPPERHPEYMGPDYKGGHILRDGLILMERPVELTQEARAEDYDLAREMIRAKERQIRSGETPEGELPRNHEIVPRFVRRGVDQIQVPDDGPTEA